MYDCAVCVCVLFVFLFFKFVVVVSYFTVYSENTHIVDLWMHFCCLGCD
jgi:hypothetical protein